MITLEQAITLAKKAHEGQWRKPTKLQIRLETIPNYILTKLQRGDIDSYITMSEHKITIDNHLQLYVQKPYITHPLAVMDMMSTEEEKIVAVLHDVIEDCEGYGLGRIADYSRFYINVRIPYVENFDCSYNIWAALNLLTHEKHVPYEEYIKNITSKQFIEGLTDKKPNKLAIKVKLADIMHNLSDNPSNYAKKKYLKAIPILLEAL